MEKNNKKILITALIFAIVFVIVGAGLIVHDFASAYSLLADGHLAFFNELLVTMIISILLILLGLGILIFIFSKNRKRNVQMREELELLKAQNEEIQNMAQHQRLELIGTMTGSIAHEFNNLLTPIMGYSLMTMEKLPEGNDELLDNLSEIYEASEKAKKLISRISMVSRKNAKEEFALISPVRILEKVLDMVKPAIPPRVEIIKDFKCSGKSLYANEMQIGQLLLNLIVNSFHAMSEKGGTLTVRAFCDNESIIFKVKDTGIGIPKEDIPRLYDPFFTTKKMDQGTGLGLAIVNRIVEEHNGKIEVESEVGKGTEFTITFPPSKE